MTYPIVVVTKKNFEQFFELLSEEMFVLGKTTFDVALKEQLLADVSQPHPKYEAFLIMANENAIGFVVVEMMYSTFNAKSRLFIEDVYISEPHRKQGVAKDVIQYCVELARERNCYCIDGCVLDWNDAAKNFCKRLGGEKLNWEYYRGMIKN